MRVFDVNAVGVNGSSDYLTSVYDEGSVVILLMHCGAQSVEVLSGGGGEAAGRKGDGCGGAATLDPPSNEARVIAGDAAELAGH